MADIVGDDILAIDDRGDLTIDTQNEVVAGAAVPVLAEDGAPAPQELPPGAQRQSDGSVIYTLRHACAIKFRRASDGATRQEAVGSLHLHRLTGGDMRAITAASSDMMTVVAIARSAKMAEARMKLVFDAMDAEDAAACGEVVSSFLGTGRRTGR